MSASKFHQSTEKLAKDAGFVYTYSMCDVVIRLYGKGSYKLTSAKYRAKDRANYHAKGEMTDGSSI